MNKLFADNDEITPAKVLNLLRNDVKKSLRQDEIDPKAVKNRRLEIVKDGMDMAVMVFDFKNNKMQYSGAYNPFYLVKNKELHHFKGDRMPVGIHIIEKPSFTIHEISLESEDTIYAFSDG